jgi:hypothetical protein
MAHGEGECGLGGALDGWGGGGVRACLGWGLGASSMGCAGAQNAAACLPRRLA